MRLKNLDILCSTDALRALPEGKLMINTINAYSYVTARNDSDFADALTGAGALLPDGVGVVWGCRLIGAKCRPKERITGWDLFHYEMERLNARGGSCFFMGTSEKTLGMVRDRAADEYPNIRVHTYSPPYKDVFSDDDNDRIVKAINTVRPDLLWIGMSAPKQEKWLMQNFSRLDIAGHAGCIGAVFSFFAGTEKRAPRAWQQLGLEWFYRLIHDPRRLWRRYIIGNLRFSCYLLGEFISKQH